jgi:DNA-binding beta-propeller fold protein YncE
MRITPVLTLVLGLTLGTPALAAQATLDKTIAGFASPESVVVAGDYVYVSNVGEKLEPFAKDGDGFISRLDRQGNVRELKWKSGLNAPKGMIAHNGVLYVADIDRVLGWRMSDGKPVFELDLSATGVRFLNAFAGFSGHRLLLSATDQNKVYVIHTRHPRYEELRFDHPPQGPNGLDLSGHILTVAEWGTDGRPNGKVRQYRLKGNQATQIAQYELAPPGLYDGVVGLGGQRYLVSNWVRFEPAGVLHWLDTRTDRQELVQAPVMAGPADLARDGNVLWVPAMLEGKVYRLQLQGR